MKRWIWLIVLAQLAVPALAQDEGGDGGLFDLSSLGNAANVAPEFDPVAEARAMLARANVAPMDKKQESDLKKLYEKEIKVVAKTYETRFGVPLKEAMGALQTSARGRRGGNSRRPDSPQVAEARLSTQLLDKMIAGLRIDQQGPLRRHQSEQARIAKLNTLTNSLAVAGTPLSPAQLTEVEAILSRESRLRTLLIVEAKGAPYQSQVVQLEAQTAERLVALLDPPRGRVRSDNSRCGRSPNATSAFPRNQLAVFSVRRESARIYECPTVISLPLRLRFIAIRRSNAK